jgi:drug/metabolite transporter (DMT)-like permease
MNKAFIAIIIGISLSLVTALGDYFVKLASSKSHLSGWYFLIIGAIIYSLTAVGWFVVMREIKLADLVVLYSVSCIIFVSLIGIIFFHEKISFMEVFGIVLAIIAVVILLRN